MSNFTLPPNVDGTLEVPDTGSFTFLTNGPSTSANGTVPVGFDDVISFGQASGTSPVSDTLLGGSAGDSNPANNISVVNLSYNGVPATLIDLRPTISSSPTDFPVDNTLGALTVSIEYVGETDSFGNQIIRVGKNTAITNVALVPNSGWKLDATSSSAFSVLTYAPSIPGLETLSAEPTYVMAYGSSSGPFPVTASIPVNSGGDINMLNIATAPVRSDRMRIERLRELRTVHSERCRSIVLFVPLKVVCSNRHLLGISGHN